MYRPDEDKNFMSKTEMEESIISLLGGRVAEGLVLNDISTGASNDIERATKIARDMVTKYGMSDAIGTINFGSDQGEVFLGRDFTHTKDYSEETAAAIDKEVKRIIDKAYKRCQDILSEHMDKLHAVAEKLLEKEKIDGEEFDALFIKVGLPHNPQFAGNGGFNLGRPVFPSIDSSSAVSSPHTNAPAPNLISKSKLKSVPQILFPSIPYSFA